MTPPKTINLEAKKVCGSKKSFLGPPKPQKITFLGSKKWNNRIFSKRRNSMIWPHIGGCSHSGGGLLDTPGTYGSIRFIYILLLASVIILISMQTKNEMHFDCLFVKTPHNVIVSLYWWEKLPHALWQSSIICRTTKIIQLIRWAMRQ